jgi:RES domain-containing protein
MRLWRLARRPYRALDGEGARLAGGRWNSAGTPLVYTSVHLSLAALELLVHVDPDELPEDLVALEIEVPDGMPAESVAMDELPSDWREPGHLHCVALGDEWARRGQSAILRVPSVVIPSEQNWLVNPRHPDAARLVVRRFEPFSFDERLLR